MAQQKYYTVIAGRKEPADLEVGFLDPKNGQPKGQTQKIKVAVGSILIPNYSRLWGRRVNEKTIVKPNERSLPVNDKEYKGQIQFLPWGHPAGEVIEARYMRRSNSLDKQFQEQVQKLQSSEEDVYIVLEQGINDFEPETHANLIEFLKHHSQNFDSPSKDPDNKEYKFVNYDSEKRKSKQHSLQTRHAADSILLSAEENNDTLRILADIFRIDTLLQDDMIFDKLAEKVQQNPADFVAKFQSFKEQVQQLFGYLLEESLIDLGTPGVIAFVAESGKKHIIYSGIDESEVGNSKIAWVVANILDPEVYDAVKKLEELKSAELVKA